MKDYIIVLMCLFVSYSCSQKKEFEQWDFLDGSLCPTDNLNLSVRIDRVGNMIILYDKWFESSNVYTSTLSNKEAQDISVLLNEIGNFQFHSKNNHIHDASYYHIIANKGKTRIDVFSYNNDCEKTEMLYNYMHELILSKIKKENILFNSKTDEFVIIPPQPIGQSYQNK